MKTVRVAAAIIRSGHKIFATQRGYGEFKDGWEFPGGKIEAGETPQEALVREIREELDAEIQVGEKIDCVEYDYPAFHLSMGMLLGPDPLRGTDLKRTRAIRISIEELDSVDWLPADLSLIRKIREQMQAEEGML